MPNPAPFVSKQGAFTLYAGESRTISLRIVDEDGNTQDLTGRSFALVAFSLRDRSILLNVATLGDAEGITLGVTGEESELLYAAALYGPLGMELVEQLVDGISPILRANTLSILIRGFGGSPSLPTIVADAPVTQITFTQVDQPIIVIERGVPGLSAFEMLYIAGTIDAPTANAFTDWIESLIQARLNLGQQLDFSKPENSSLAL